MKTRKDLLDILTKTEEAQAKFFNDYGVLPNGTYSQEYTHIMMNGHVYFDKSIASLAFELRDMAVKDKHKLEQAVIKVYKTVNNDNSLDVNDVSDWNWVLDEVAFNFTPFQLIIAALLVLDCEEEKE